MSGSGATGDALERAADELAVVAAQGQADVEEPTGHDGRPEGSDVQGPDDGGPDDGGPDDGGPDDGGPDVHDADGPDRVRVAPDDVAPAPDVESPAPGHDAPS